LINGYGRSYRTVEFKATNDAYIGLFVNSLRTDLGPVNDSGFFYEIGFEKSSSRIIIRNRKNGRPLATKNIPGYNSKVSRTVTVSFISEKNGGTVEISLGTIPGENVLLSWTDPNPFDVNYIAVKTV
jgi:hypothetical protein